MIKKYKTKPEIIEAIEFTGDNLEEIEKWMPIHITTLANGFIIDSRDTCKYGDNMALKGDFIVKDNGCYFVCTSKFFHEKYEEV